MRPYFIKAEHTSQGLNKSNTYQNPQNKFDSNNTGTYGRSKNY